MIDTLAPKARAIHATSGQQLAMAVVYYSPLQFLYWYDRPSDSRDEPELEFFDRVPTVWDETKVLQGKIGEYITTARRKGDEWFVGREERPAAAHARHPVQLSARREEVRGAHLPRRHDENPDPHQSAKWKPARIDANTVLPAKLYGSGGLAIRLEPAEPGKR